MFVWWTPFYQINCTTNGSLSKLEEEEEKEKDEVAVIARKLEEKYVSCVTELCYLLLSDMSYNT